MKPEEKDVWIFGSEKRNLICYTPESIRHPAKMSLHLCREIIKRYSKKGDLILDPMAGIGTTLVEGMVLGRNVIGIEYEQKFCDMAEQNIKKVNKSMGFMNSLGKGIILKGDSRKLSEVLSKADIPNSIIFSPPFADVNKKTRAKPTNTALKNDRGLIGKRYSEDKNNIGNMKYGKIDSIITSPPYGLGKNVVGSKEEDQKKRIERLRKAGYSEKYIQDLFKEGNARNFQLDDYSENDDNLGMKKGKDYLSEMFIIYQQCLKVLKEDGYMVLVLKNFVRAGKQIRLDLDTIKLVKAAGFIYITRHYRKINNPSFWITNAIQKWEKKHPDKPHPYPLEEDVLVFRKEVKNGSKRRNLRKN